MTILFAHFRLKSTAYKELTKKSAGTSVENDTLCGGSGDDVLYGDESATGGDGVDTALYTDALAGVTVNLVAETGDDGILYTTKEGGTRTGHDTLFDIENIVAGDFDDAIIGNNITNKLEGGKGDDTLTGGGGNDTLDGGAGTNTAVFSGNYADYTISYDEATQTYTVLDKVVGRDGTDVVTHVENFQFADGTHQDIIKPTAATFSPGSGATGVGVGSDVVLTFSEAIHRGTGTIAIHSGSASGLVVAGSDDATSATITTSGNMLMINPTHDLAYNMHYSVTFADRSIHDLAENSYAGTAGSDFTTGADPYVGATQSSSGGGSGIAFVGLGVLAVLAWAIF